MTYTDRFLDALGRWQRGWKRKPELRKTVAAALARELALLPDFVREHDGKPLFRKRNLYRSEYQRELAPLFLDGFLDEGSITSWSASEAYLMGEFGDPFDDSDPNSAAGAIFRHQPAEDEVLLNIPRLWLDPEFVKTAESYRRRGGAEAKALFYFVGRRSQFEVILRAALKVEEIHRLTRPTTAESLYATVGATTEEAKGAMDELLSSAFIVPHEAMWLSAEGTHRVVDRVVETIRRRVAAWLVEHTPTRVAGRRARLKDAYELGRGAALPHAQFVGWRRLRGRGVSWKGDGRTAPSCTMGFSADAGSHNDDVWLTGRKASLGVLVPSSRSR